MKLVSRSQWGARAYRTPNGATPYSRARRGVKLHYLGTAYSDRAHDKCDDYVRQLQAQHMDGNGWSDIGYSFVVCTHGYVFEGRGLKRRNSANGSTSLNEQDYAVCLLVGSSGLTKPTDAQLHGARDAIEYCRKEGPAGTWLGGHRDGYATACPGDTVYAWVKKGAPRPSSGGTTEPTPAAGGTYTVKSGDTLSSIGEDLDVPWPDIAQANGIKTPYRITPGQKLTIPKAASTPDPSKPAPTTPTLPEGDARLSDQISLGDWVKKQWPKDKGLSDGRITVNTALGSGYAHSRRAAEATDEILKQLAVLRTEVAQLRASVTKGA